MDSTPATEQATCTDCDAENPEMRVFNREYDMTPEEQEDVHVTRDVRCQNCGSTGSVKVTYAGTEGTGCVTFENASWNQTEDDDE